MDATKGNTKTRLSPTGSTPFGIRTKTLTFIICGIIQPGGGIRGIIEGYIRGRLETTQGGFE
eukprot:scaffold62825_cov76-Cyclotella_meneghiniana.AAC.5